MNIYKIAETSGVSVATVSRVINNPARVKSSTRQKVLKVMKEIDFKPKRSRQKQFVIGVTLPDFRPGRLYDIYVREILAGIVETASRYNSSVKIIDIYELSHIPEKKGEYKEFCRTKNIDALIHIQCPLHFRKYIERIADDGIFQVSFEHQFVERKDIAWIDVDNYGGSYQMAKHLVNLGYKKFAVVTTSREYKGHLERYNGYVDALKEEGIDIPDYWDIERRLNTPDSGASATLSIMTQNKELPDVIYYTNGELGLEGMKFLSNNGITVGKDIVVSLFSDSDFPRWLPLPVVYLHQPAYEIGCTASKLIFHHTSYSELGRIISPELFISDELIKLNGNTLSGGPGGKV